jgi:Na+/H+ antiporter NhaD/arsenite permease-like protein
MDLVLVAFLITAASVEYLSDNFLRFWFRLAEELPNTGREQLAKMLHKRLSRCVLAVFTIFAGTVLLSGFVFGHLRGLAPSPELIQTAVLGAVGYLALSIALLENIILASVNATPLALRAVCLGLGVNVLAGYVLSHLFGMQYAAVGLLAGSVAFLWKSHSATRKILRDPDYRYAVA